jgi:aldehyde dehydrogenase (NAD+)
MRRRFDHWINGKPVPPAGGSYIKSTSPATGKTVTHIAEGGFADVELAVAAAADAGGSWAALAPRERAIFLQSIAEAIRANLTELTDLERSETGKLLHHARLEIDASASYFEYYAAIARALHGRTIDQGARNHTYTRHEPHGVVGVITPWNGPLNQASRSIAPALAAGNCLVAKPSEFTSTTTVRVAELASELGLPNGVLNVVTGTGPAVGTPLADHEGVGKLVFTGSVPTGRVLGHIAAERIIPITLELGGKSPLVAFADADPDAAAHAAVNAVVANAGQVCSATTRLLVQRHLHDRLVSLILERLQHLAPGEHYGPIISTPQFEKVLQYFEVALEEGATLATGGRACTDGPVAAGQYVAPTVYTNVRPEMRIAREEIFGPVLVVLPFEDESEAIDLANDSEYGLAAAIYTADIGRALRVAERLRAGQVSINGGQLGAETPFGGFNHSGHGREKGIEGLYEYTQLKTISLSLGS